MMMMMLIFLKTCRVGSNPWPWGPIVNMLVIFTVLSAAWCYGLAYQKNLDYKIHQSQGCFGSRVRMKCVYERRFEDEKSSSAIHRHCTSTGYSSDVNKTNKNTCHLR